MCAMEFDCTAINIREQINEQLCSYGISFDQVVLVSDQGYNIKAALSLDTMCSPCSEHISETYFQWI